MNAKIQIIDDSKYQEPALESMVTQGETNEHNKPCTL